MFAERAFVSLFGCHTVERAVFCMPLNYLRLIQRWIGDGMLGDMKNRSTRHTNFTEFAFM